MCWPFCCSTFQIPMSLFHTWISSRCISSLWWLVFLLEGKTVVNLFRKNYRTLVNKPHLICAIRLSSAVIYVWVQGKWWLPWKCNVSLYLLANTSGTHRHVHTHSHGTVFLICLIQVTYQTLLGKSQHWCNKQLLPSRKHKMK